MLKIAIVDDENEQIYKIQKIISNFFNDKNVEQKVFCFNSGEELLQSNVPFDIAFLDIQMNGLDGIETAQRLRVWNKWVSLIYVTSYEEYIKKAMTIHPFSYITKPYNEQEIIQTLTDYLSYQNSRINQERKEYFKVSNDNTLRYIDIDDIYYFSYIYDRTVRIQLKTENYIIKESITSILKNLNNDIFIVPNQSYIVNIHHIREIDGKQKRLIMENNDIIFITRRKYKEVFDSLNKYMTNGEF